MPLPPGAKQSRGHSTDRPRSAHTSREVGRHGARPQSPRPQKKHSVGVSISSAGDTIAASGSRGAFAPPAPLPTTVSVPKLGGGSAGSMSLEAKVGRSLPPVPIGAGKQIVARAASPRG